MRKKKQKEKKGSLLCVATGTKAGNECDFAGKY